MSRRLVPLLVLSLTAGTIPAQEKPARVDAAGDPLPPGAVARLGTVRLRHPDWVRSLAASPDGKTLASAGEWRIRLWELPSGRPLKSVPHYKGPADPGFEKAPALAFTATGELLALGNFSKGCVLYEPATGKKLKEFKEYSADVFSADGTAAVLISDNRYALWDVTAGRELGKVPSLHRFGGRRPATLSADGKILALPEFGGVRRVDTRTEKDLRAISTGFRSPDSLALSRDGKALATVRWTANDQVSTQDVDSQVTVWDTESGKRRCESKTYNRYVQPLAFSGDGKLLAAGWGDMTYDGGRTIVLLDAATGKEIDRPVGHEAAVEAVAFVAGTDTVVSACEHDTLRTWDATTGKQLRESKLPKLSTLVFARDGKQLLLRRGDRLQFRDLATDKVSWTIQDLNAGRFHLSDDAKYLAAWAEINGGDFRLWETSTGKELTQFRAKEAFAVAFSADSQFLVRIDPGKVSDCHLRVLELPTGKELRSFKTRYDVGRLALSPDGKVLAASHRDQAIDLWNLAKGEKLWATAHPARDRGRSSVSFANPIAFSPDGKVLASGGDDHTVRLWDVATGKEAHKFIGHEGAVLALAFSPDGKTLASASEDTTILIWSLAAK